MTELERRANEMRSDIVRMIAEAGSGHPGGSLSCADILAALYFGGVLDHDPERQIGRASCRERVSSPV